MQEKQRCMILFFQFFNHFLCRFASRYCQKCLLSEKLCGTHECILYELFRYLEKAGVLKFLSNASFA